MFYIVKKRKRIILADSDEESDLESADRSKTAKIDQPNTESKDTENTNDDMDIDTATVMKKEELDEEFDKEIEQAAEEEKEAKKEEQEMMSIIHTM
jgi:phosphotransacetylase